MNAGPAIAKRSKPNVDPSTMAIGEIIYAANAIESLNGAIRESAKAPDEADEGGADLVGVAELRRALADGAVFQFQQRAQLGAIEFADVFLHILRQHEIDEGAKFFVMVGEDAVPPPGDPVPV